MGLAWVFWPTTEPNFKNDLRVVIANRIAGRKANRIANKEEKRRENKIRSMKAS